MRSQYLVRRSCDDAGPQQPAEIPKRPYAANLPAVISGFRGTSSDQTQAQSRRLAKSRQVSWHRAETPSSLRHSWPLLRSLAVKGRRGTPRWIIFYLLSPDSGAEAGMQVK